MLASCHLLRWILVHWFARQPSRNGLIWIMTLIPRPFSLAILCSAVSASVHGYTLLGVSPALAILLSMLLPHFGRNWDNSDRATQFSQGLDLSIGLGSLLSATAIRNPLPNFLPLPGSFYVVSILLCALLIKVLAFTCNEAKTRILRQIVMNELGLSFATASLRRDRAAIIQHWLVPEWRYCCEMSRHPSRNRCRWVGPQDFRQC